MWKKIVRWIVQVREKKKKKLVVIKLWNGLWIRIFFTKLPKKQPKLAFAGYEYFLVSSY